jgi:hypothetical protein
MGTLRNSLLVLADTGHFSILSGGLRPIHRGIGPQNKHTQNRENRGDCRDKLISPLVPICVENDTYRVHSTFVFRNFQATMPPWKSWAAMGDLPDGPRAGQAQARAVGPWAIHDMRSVPDRPSQRVLFRGLLLYLQ